MRKWFKKQWDLFVGIVSGTLMAVLAKFELHEIQLCYSIIILILLSIGFFRMIKQAVCEERQRKTMLDTMVDGQQAVKAVRMAQHPTTDGELLGYLTIKLWEGLKSIMKKFKEFMDKFKGIVLSIALGILTVVEGFGGFINGMCGGTLTINGVAVIPLITLVSAIVVGIISNGWTKEEKEKIKALFSKSSTDENVLADIKKTLKENKAKEKEFNKILATKKTELDNLNGELVTKQNTLSAKRNMSVMTPQLATAEDVQLAEIAVNDTVKKIEEKKKEIAEVETTIENLTSTISALKSQL